MPVGRDKKPRPGSELSNSKDIGRAPLKGICNPSLNIIHLDVFVYKASPSYICFRVFHWLVDLLFRDKVMKSYRSFPVCRCLCLFQILGLFK